MTTTMTSVQQPQEAASASQHKARRGRAQLGERLRCGQRAPLRAVQPRPQTLLQPGFRCTEPQAMHVLKHLLRLFSAQTAHPGSSIRYFFACHLTSFCRYGASQPGSSSGVKQAHHALEFAKGGGDALRCLQPHCLLQAGPP